VSQPQRFHVGPLQGSSAEFICSGLFRHPSMQQWNHLVVLNDAEEAAYFHNTIENLTGALDILYFPSSFKNRKNYRLLNSSHVMLRTEALMKCSTAQLNKKVLVTYPEALFEKVVLAKELSGNVISIKSGDTLEVDKLIERLTGYGFERTDFVYEPGQLAMRGGILDIYSFGNEKPYRVELFGNEVDSIRLFDPETQLSERKLLQVNIIPNIETNFDHKEKVSLLEFLPANTVVWLQDYDLIREKLLVQEEDLDLFFKREALETPKRGEETEDTVKEMVSPEEFLHEAILHEQLEKRNIIEFGYRPHWGGKDINFPILEQPAFNRKFDLLIADLQRWEKKGFTLFLFAENPRQLERLHSIFSDLNAELTFTPLVTAIHEGFIDEGNKVVCYTDHQIFQLYHKYRVKQAYNKNKALTLRTLRELQPGDYVTHIDHGVGIYSGLQKIESNGHLQEAVRIRYKDNDLLYVNINSLHKISKYTGKEGTVPKVNKIGSEAWQRLKEKTKSKVK
jgi:transcription-repair coupling factor (superfamily II helicase)